jgi:eukaryotic-like serine/threonine-protein kinase
VPVAGHRRHGPGLAGGRRGPGPAGGVKLLRDEYAQDPSFVSRLRAEARYAAAVTHPGIASVFDYGEVTTPDGPEPTAFLVMEVVAGEPLSWLLAREGRLGPDRSLDIVGQAAVAVGAAHRVGLVHRDIKPANLLVGLDGTVKVTDFSVAQALGQGQGDQRELLIGTAGYLSPRAGAGAGGPGDGQTADPPAT